jgi:hypothetical protein
MRLNELCEAASTALANMTGDELRDLAAQIDATPDELHSRLTMLRAFRVMESGTDPERHRIRVDLDSYKAMETWFYPTKGKDGAA